MVRRTLATAILVTSSVALSIGIGHPVAAAADAGQRFRAAIAGTVSAERLRIVVRINGQTYSITDFDAPNRSYQISPNARIDGRRYPNVIRADGKQYVEDVALPAAERPSFVACDSDREIYDAVPNEVRLLEALARVRDLRVEGDKYNFSFPKSRKVVELGVPGVDSGVIRIRDGRVSSLRFSEGVADWDYAIKFEYSGSGAVNIPPPEQISRVDCPFVRRF